MNEIIIAAILLSLLLIASIAVIWFIDKRINDVESSIRDLTLPSNGLDAEDTKESVWSVSWNTPPQFTSAPVPPLWSHTVYHYAPADAQAAAPTRETLASEVAQSVKAPLEWVIGREYLTRDGETVKLVSYYASSSWPYLFSDGCTRSGEGFFLVTKYPDFRDIISEASPKRDMAGVALASLYEKRSKSTHWKRKNAGVCVRCGKAEPDGSKTACAGCSKKRRIIARAKRAEEQERGHYAE